MTNHTSTRIAAVLMLVLVALSATRCSLEDPTEGLELRIALDPITTMIAVNVVNAATMQPITDRSITLTFEGPNKSDVVSLSAGAISDMEIDEGIAAFALNEARRPSTGSPVKLVLVAEADGFITTSLPVELLDTGAHGFTLYMIQQGNPPQGVSDVRTTTGQADGSGTVTVPINIQTPAEPVTGASASVSVPTNTVVRDANGTPLSGQLTTTVVYYNNVSDASLLSFPGGFAVNLAQNEGGSQEDASFITGGFSSIEITDASGRQAETFGSPIEISIQIPGTTINPETGAPIQSGETIGIWSYQTETGEWTFENQGVATGPNANGNFTVTFEAMHLSAWNLDWKFGQCQIGKRINFTGKPDGAPMVVELRRPDGTLLSIQIITDNFIEFQRAPQGVPLVLVAIAPDGSEIGQMAIPDLCATAPMDMPVSYPTTPPGTEILNVRIQISGTCRGDEDIVYRPSLIFWYLDPNAPSSGVLPFIAMQGGEALIRGMTVPKTYTFYTVYDGDVVSKDFLVTGDNIVDGELRIGYDVELPNDVCP